LLTVPPVGSGSVLAGCSSGIEPIFALSYVRKSKSLSKSEFEVSHPLVREYMEKMGLSHINELPKTFVTAHEIEPIMRVRMQATIQKHIDHAISSTVNLAKDVSPETIGDIYFEAWKAGCKGITVYREGSREGILLTKEAKEGEKPARATLVPRPRPKVVKGKTYRMKTELGTVFITVNEDDEGIFEVFVQGAGQVRHLDGSVHGGDRASHFACPALWGQAQRDHRSVEFDPWLAPRGARGRHGGLLRARCHRQGDRGVPSGRGAADAASRSEAAATAAKRVQRPRRQARRRIVPKLWGHLDVHQRLLYL
jgi:ribonucleotide reductase alpha subunit